MKRILTAFAMGLLASTAAYAEEPGVTDTEIRIGDVNPMTGPAGTFIGKAVAYGSKVAAAEINAAGGINGRMITIVTEDDGYVPARSFQALTKLIEVDEIFALNGTSGTANAMAMMPLIEEHGLPTVVTTAPNDLIYTPVRPTVFTIGASYADAYYAQLKYIHDNVKVDNAVFGLLRQDDDFGVAVERGYERAVKEFGIKDGMRVVFKRGAASFAAEMAQMKQSGVNVIATGAMMAGAANILAEARKLGMDVQVAALWTEDMPGSVKLSSPSGYDYYVADYVAFDGPAIDAFLEKAKKYATADEVAGMNRYTYITYVGLHTLAEAMKRCGQELTRACTVEQLRGLKDFDTQGLTAPISFDNENQLSGTALAIYQLDSKQETFKKLSDFIQY